MITRTSAFVTSDKQTFAELDAAIGHEIVLMLETSADSKEESWKLPCIAEWIVASREKLLDALTTTATSKSRARAINGGKKKRKAAAAMPEPIGPIVIKEMP